MSIQNIMAGTDIAGAAARPRGGGGVGPGAQDADAGNPGRAGATPSPVAGD